MAFDLCEALILRALEKLGWTLVRRQYPVFYSQQGRRPLLIDSHLIRQDQEILVEVKCFTLNKQLLGDFYEALGQYLIYRQALTITQNPLPLYLAIPATVYANFGQEPLVQDLLKSLKIGLVVVDMDIEEVTQWLT
jgi:hypothetical protein